MHAPLAELSPANQRGQGNWASDQKPHAEGGGGEGAV